MFLLMIAIAYSCFIGFLWLQKYLNEKSQLFERILVGNLPFEENIAELKLFRVFCLRFIQESRPINIRLTYSYMKCLEKFWEQERLYPLVDQINEQLNTLEKMFEWADDINARTRDTKMGIAAVLLAAISMTAVVAQLISTIDIGTPPILDITQRILLIFIGFLLGIIVTCIIFFSPVFEQSIKVKRHPKKVKILLALQKYKAKAKEKLKVIKN